MKILLTAYKPALQKGIFHEYKIAIFSLLAFKTCIFVYSKRVV